ncbi:DNA-processing protein DprA [Agromyces sp. Leaf222]|uniref:DNA-processing protein DprA n=1 Tax=Agromyces sp. Leaf222 TaxID=1735688 RepID=UPI0006F5A8EF|nr:DNA-processing protein DprA [Agromyces sp. Leaf222]KQM83231.1 hypothetical protein ASE68_08330 [Agromyces sp. Leaf222]
MSAVERAARHLRQEFSAVRRGVLRSGDETVGHLDDEPVTPQEEPSTAAFARALLGTLAEPGDGTLGRIVAALGAVRTADLLLGTASADLVAVDRLVAETRDAGESLSASDLENGLARWTPRIDHGAFVRGIAQAQRVGAVFIAPGDACWPVGVDDLGVHAPLGLWVRGDPWHLRSRIPSVALVGARAATGYGEHMTMELSAGLVDRGFAVVSGGAYGIDGMAHRSALASGGTTIAFLAGGVDRFYPVGHDGLLQRITETGAVVSELPCGASPTKWRFLQRNRLIAAASAATVVLEAGARSGSLNTAAHAAALGRPLGALPGPVTSPASAGCHRLLREFDAVCIVNAEQVVELVGAIEPPTIDESTTRDARATRDRDAGPDSGSAAPEELRVLDALSTRAQRDVADLARRSGLGTGEVMAVLGVLELDGIAVHRADGWVRRRRAS